MAGYVGNVPVPQSVREDQSFTATAGQTTFNTLGYTDGNRIKVTLNGVLLEGGGVDYTATNGSDVVLTVAAAVDDIVRFETFNEVQLVNSVTTTPTFKTSATLLNETQEDIEGGRESTLIFQGEQSGGELTTLAEIEASHDGTADDEKGDLIFRTNDGNDGTSPTERLRINSGGDMLFSSEDPSLTLANTTHEDSDGGRESTIAFQGEQSGGEISLLAQIEASHDGTADDQKGDLIFRTNDGSDGASPTERIRIDSDGRTIIGHSDGTDGSVSANFKLQLLGTDYTSSSFGLARFENGINAPSIVLHKSRGTSIGGDTVVQDNDELGRLRFYGNDGTDFAEGARISAEVNGTASSNDMPTDLVFSTTADGASSPTERMRILESGGITFNGDTAAANALDDYEEGTFNFALSGYHGSPSPKLNLPSHYTKIGNTVHFWTYATSLNTTSYSGNMIFQGLPFTSPAPYAIGNISLDHIGTYSGYGPHILISGNDVYGVLHQSNASSWSAIMHNVHTSAGAVYLYGTYKV